VACFSTPVQIRYGLLDWTGSVRAHDVSVVRTVGRLDTPAAAKGAITSHLRKCKRGLMYYVIEVSRWCIALHRETKMRSPTDAITYPTGDCGAIFLVSAEPLQGATE